MKKQQLRAADSRRQYARAQEILRASKRIAVFTEAGVSVESGIPSFRDDGSFWSRFSQSQLANVPGIIRLAQENPILVAEFAVAVFKPIVTARPNPAHAAVAALERTAEIVTVITENIDGLHQLAGSANVVEIHGSAYEIVRKPLLGASKVTRLSRDELAITVAKLEALQQNSRASLSDLLKASESFFGIGLSGAYHPNLLMFSDRLSPERWQAAVNAATECDCMLVIGTSQLMPAATLPARAKGSGARLILIHPTRGECDVWLQGAAGEVLPELVENL